MFQVVLGELGVGKARHGDGLRAAHMRAQPCQAVSGGLLAYFDPADYRERHAVE
ncbi:hypothetical protein ACPCSD_19045 [Streptomyces griseoincarnatus]|uniref:hypothetical protein n=1 Tax=Streptomyces sp. HNS054 TaxID=1662446 RepID=UPI000A52D016|nr:hypothetical protein [Streptomyces sp. HNS054]WPW23694.1 hypothetical protein UBV09_14495 [Streptomyces griseoincarnatus]